MTFNTASLLGLINQLKAILITIFAFGVVILAVGWLIQKFGITFVRLPSAAPQELVYAAGLIWLLK